VEDVVEAFDLLGVAKLLCGTDHAARKLNHFTLHTYFFSSDTNL
jgi:hypothetical protein